MVQKCSVAIPEQTAILKEKKHLTQDVMLLSFEIMSPFTFDAGQYVIIKIMKETDFRWKSYSILNPPSENGKLDLCVKIIPGGFASEAFKSMNKGTVLSFRGPLGHLTFDAASSEHWFIANGTGVVPFYSMIMEYVPHHPQKKCTLIFGVRSQQDLFLHQELKELAEKHKNFHYIPTLSRDAWEGSMGRVQTHLPQDMQNKTFYICGLKEMVLETQELLLSKGVSKERIRVERYT